MMISCALERERETEKEVVVTLSANTFNYRAEKFILILTLFSRFACFVELPRADAS